MPKNDAHGFVIAVTFDTARGETRGDCMVVIKKCAIFAVKKLRKGINMIVERTTSEFVIRFPFAGNTEQMQDL